MKQMMSVSIKQLLWSNIMYAQSIVIEPTIDYNSEDQQLFIYLGERRESRARNPIDAPSG